MGGHSPEPLLLQELHLGSVVVPNRVMMSPMSQNSATPEGMASDWHMVHYGSRAVGGCGLILVEDTAVDERGRVSTRCLCLSTPEHAATLRPIVEFCRAQGAVVGIQIAHAGRKALRDRKGDGAAALAADATPFADDWAVPQAADASDLAAVVDAFAASARLAAAAGFETVEVHSSNGYLLHAFLSPLTNLRADAYGGSAAARQRLLVEVVTAVRAAFAGAVMVRLPASDEVEGGLEVEDIVEVGRALERLGVDAIDVAGGSLKSGTAPVSVAIQRRCAEALKDETDLVVVAGGGVRTAADAEARVRDGACDAVALARPLLSDPYWVRRATEELGAEPTWPLQYPLAPIG